MTVYFVRAETTSFVKIGYAVSVARRLLHLQAGCPYRLTVARELPGDRLAETAFHRLFAQHHIDRDWFYWDPSMATATLSPAPITTSGEAGFAALIEELGGPSVVARRIGVVAPTVFKMRNRNRVPAKYWPAFHALGVPAERLMACEVSRVTAEETFSSPPSSMATQPEGMG